MEVFYRAPPCETCVCGNDGVGKIRGEGVDAAVLSGNKNLDVANDGDVDYVVDNCKVGRGRRWRVRRSASPAAISCLAAWVWVRVMTSAAVITAPRSAREGAEKVGDLRSKPGRAAEAPYRVGLAERRRAVDNPG